MGTREALAGGDEVEAFSRRARKVHVAKAGQRAWVKRKFWKRVRKLRKLEACSSREA